MSQLNTDQSPFVPGATVVRIGYRAIGRRVTFFKSTVEKVTPTGKFRIVGVEDTLWTPERTNTGTLQQPKMEWRAVPPRVKGAGWGSSWNYDLWILTPDIEARIKAQEEERSLEEDYNRLRSRIGEAGALDRHQIDAINAILDNPLLGKAITSGYVHADPDKEKLPK